MPQNTEHPEYSKAKPKWERCCDAYGGTDAIKSAGTKYLPKLSEQDDTQYTQYRARALFYGATERTVSGLAGAALSKDFEYELPPKLAYMLDDATTSHVSLQTFTKIIVQELLKVGRCGILVDRSKSAEGSSPYLCLYNAQDIINWDVNEEGKLVRVVLRETGYDVDPKDKYRKVECVKYRELSLEDSSYVQYLHTQKAGTNKDQIEFETTTTTPTKRGSPLKEIPFVFVNAYGIGVSVCNPPLLPLVDVNISHYCNSADLEHGRHFTGLPTPYICGSDVKDKMTIGSSTAWVFQNPDTKVGFLEFTGQGLQSLERAMSEKEKQMAVLGARLLEGQKVAAEAAETVKLRQSGDIFTLRGINIAAADAISLALAHADKWEGGDGKVHVEPNLDFIDTQINPQEITALVQAWQSGAMSLDTLLYNFARGELHNPEEDGIEEEKLRIASERSAPSPDLPTLTEEEKAKLAAENSPQNQE